VLTTSEGGGEEGLSLLSLGGAVELLAVPVSLLLEGCLVEVVHHGPVQIEAGQLSRSVSPCLDVMHQFSASLRLVHIAPVTDVHSVSLMVLLLLVKVVLCFLDEIIIAAIG